MQRRLTIARIALQIDRRSMKREFPVLSPRCSQNEVAHESAIAKCAQEVSLLSLPPWCAATILNLVKLLQSCLQGMNCLLKKFEADQAIARFNAIILCCMWPANMTSQNQADNLVAKFCKVANIYAEDSLNQVLIVGLDESIGHHLR